MNDPMNPESCKLDVGVTPEYAKEMLVEFSGDTFPYYQKANSTCKRI